MFVTEPLRLKQKALYRQKRTSIELEDVTVPCRRAHIRRHHFVSSKSRASKMNKRSTTFSVLLFWRHKCAHDHLLAVLQVACSNF